MAVPDAALANSTSKTLTSAPHWASSPEDYATAVYVADKFKAAGIRPRSSPTKSSSTNPSRSLLRPLTPPATS